MIVECDAERLMAQAPWTIETYLNQIVEILDRKFGAGYAKSNPELMAACVKCCVIDFSSAVICKIFEAGVSELVEVLRELSEDLSAE